MSQGFHPKLRMSFPSALPLGVAGEDEVLELEFREPVDPKSVLETLNRCAFDGLVFKNAVRLSNGEKKAILKASVYEMEIPPRFHADLLQNIDDLLSAATFFVEKANGKNVDLRPVVRRLVFDPESGRLTAELLSTKGPDAGIRELLSALSLGEQTFRTVFPVRKECLLEK